MNAESVGRMIRERFAVVGRDELFVHHQLAADDFEFHEVVTWLEDVRGKHVLDLGCGKGRMVAALAARGARVIGVDPVLVFLRPASTRQDAEVAVTARLPLACGEAEWVPFPEGTFDAVLCVEDLEHVPDTGRALREMARVLKPGGRLVVIDKNILGLDRKWLVPVALKKWWLERRGCWMYTPDFPFREKWFRPAHVRRLLERHCARVECHYLISGRTLLPFLFRAIPQAHQYVSWRALK